MTMKIKTNGSDRQWEKLVKLGPGFSPVFDPVTKSVPVDVSAERL